MKKDKGAVIEIPRMKRGSLDVGIKGTTPLIVHRFADKAKKQMLDKQKGKANKGKEFKNPIADFVDTLYIMQPIDRDELIGKMEDDGIEPGDDVTKYFKNIRLGFPAAGFKLAAVSACRNIDGIPMTLARGSFFVLEDTFGCVEIKYKKLYIREDMVRLNGKSADIRHRACFEDWQVKLNVEFNPVSLSAEQICNLIDMGGFSVGIGDWRPERNGSSGKFELIH